MVNLKEDCKNCIHHKTCKYSELYNKFYEKIAERANYLGEQYEYDGYTIDFTCQHYTTLSRRDFIK